jgi:hypothetical protein
MKNVTAELLKHFRAVRYVQDGFSVGDILRETGVGSTACRRVLKMLIADGSAEFAGYRSDTRMDGQVCRVPLYRLVKPNGKRGNKKSLTP